MAKKSIINRNKKRIALNLKFENKRKKLKKIVMNKKLSLEERFKSQMKLSKLTSGNIICSLMPKV